MHYFWSIVLIVIGVLCLIGFISAIAGKSKFKNKGEKRSGVFSTLIIGIVALIWGVSSWPAASAKPVTATETPKKTVAANHPVTSQKSTKSSNTTSSSSGTGPTAADIQWYKKNSQLPAQLSNGVGIGDSIQWIEQNDGKPSTVQGPIDKAGTGQDAYNGDNIQVSYMYGRTYFYEQDYGPNNEIGITEAKAVASRVLPKDAVYTGKQYTTSIGGAQEQIYIYHSKQIESLWPADMFANKDGTKQPGVVDVAYQYDTLNNPTKIMAVIVFISDNP